PFSARQIGSKASFIPGSGGRKHHYFFCSNCYLLVSLLKPEWASISSGTREDLTQVAYPNNNNFHYRTINVQLAQFPDPVFCSRRRLLALQVFGYLFHQKKY